MLKLAIVFVAVRLDRSDAMFDAEVDVEGVTND